MKKNDFVNRASLAISNSLWFKRASRFLTASILTLFLCCAIALFAVSAYNKVPPKPSGSMITGLKSGAVHPSGTPYSPAMQQPGRIETEILTIQPYGFNQREITRPAGRFLLMVDNRSGLESVTLEIQADTSITKLQEALVPRKQLDWQEVFDLPPGRYSITEANHPSWGCQLTITAN